MDFSTSLNAFTSQKIINYDKWKINLDGFYDEEYSGWRWSVDVSYPGGTMASGGYGIDNEILYKTQKEALEHGLRIDILAPTPETPSMTMALERYIADSNKGK